MSVQNPQLAGFLLTGSRCISFMLKDLLLGFMTVHIFYLQYTSLIAVLTESLFTL